MFYNFMNLKLTDQFHGMILLSIIPRCKEFLLMKQFQGVDLRKLAACWLSKKLTASMNNANWCKSGWSVEMEK